MHHILTTRQSARALLAINDYISCLWALSSLWLAGLLCHENEKHKNYLDDVILKTDSPHPMKWSLGFEFVQDQSYDSPFNGLLLFFNPKLPLGLGKEGNFIFIFIFFKFLQNLEEAEGLKYVLMIFYWSFLQNIYLYFYLKSDIIVILI